MDKKPFQFRLSTVLLLIAIVPFWGFCSLIVNPMKFGVQSPVLAICVLAGIAAALYRIVGRYRHGWAIATLAAPVLAVGTLLLVAVLVT